MKKLSKIVAVMLAALLSLPVGARDTGIRAGAIALESIQHVRDVLDVSILPEGSRVATTVVSSTAEGGQTHIWLTARGATGSRQLTFSANAVDKGESEPLGDEFLSDAKTDAGIAARDHRNFAIQ
jgi:hypothetical protein